MLFLQPFSGARKSKEKDQAVPAVSGASQYAKAKRVPLAKSRTSSDGRAPWFGNGNKLANMPSAPKERPMSKQSTKGRKGTSTNAGSNKPGKESAKRSQKVSKGAASTSGNTIPNPVSDEDEDEDDLPEFS